MNPRFAKRALSRLERLLPDQVVADKQLAKSTTFRVGGPAAVFAVADSLHDLNVIVGTAREYDIPILLLGRGSNLLISDKGFPGIVLQLGKDFQKITVLGDEIVSGAAVTLTNLIQAALKHSLKGLAFAIGIPGTVGAAVAINAGAFDSDMGSVTRQVTAYTNDCRLLSIGRDEIGFAYRRTAIEKDMIILEAGLKLAEGREEQIRSEMEINFRKRKESQPLGLPSAGCVFRNPDGYAAGKLVEEAGCKGWRAGGAEVSDKHANYIINRGGATAADIYALIRKVQKEVKEKSGILLELEIKIVGEFE